MFIIPIGYSGDTPTFLVVSEWCCRDMQPGRDTHISVCPSEPDTFGNHPARNRQAVCEQKKRLPPVAQVPSDTSNTINPEDNAIMVRHAKPDDIGIVHRVVVTCGNDGVHSFTSTVIE